MLIERLSNIDEIIDLQKKYYNVNGIYPFNVSNWTVSNKFRIEMEKHFEHCANISPIDYLYSYNITDEIKENVMRKLGVPNTLLSNKTCLFFPNNTLSIVNICNYLQKMNEKRIGILYPAYFSITSCLSSYGITYTPFYISRKKDGYKIPLKEILQNNIDIIWITSPIYSTGTSYSPDTITQIEYLLKKNILVISDESFCMQDQELIRLFSKYKNFIGIYCPHKALSFNSYKFSAIICDNSMEDFFEQWLDVFCGNLPQTTIASIYHYLSDNFCKCYNAFKEFTCKALVDVKSILQYFPNIETDDCINGNLMTLYIENLDYDLSKNLEYLNDVMNNTHAIFYPGYLNGFSKNLGFCFRINLALYSPDFLASLRRLLLYFSDY